MSAPMCCATCGRSDVRLYRPYAEFLRDKNIRCNEHVPEPRDVWVPCVECSEDGSVWGLWIDDPRAKADFERWRSLPEADPTGWTRPIAGEEAIQIVRDAMAKSR